MPIIIENFMCQRKQFSTKEILFEGGLTPRKFYDNFYKEIYL